MGSHQTPSHLYGRPAAHPYWGPFLDESGRLAGPEPIAHRGGSNVWPQNTMAAFESAVGLGYRVLETDVQATADGVLAVFHDDLLEPVADRPGRISELPWSEVRRARVGGEPIPRLEDLLDAFDGVGTDWGADSDERVRISIDPKTDAAVEPLIDLLKRRRAAHDDLQRLCFGSFSEARLARLHAAFGEDICLSFSPAETARLVRLSALGRPPKNGFRGRIVSIPPKQKAVPLATRRLVRYAHRLGLAVYVWTVDERAQMERMADIGVDGIMTDEPHLLLKVLAERGHWPPATSGSGT